ncbi:MAG: hypothetical protein P8181_07665, partial [bacterium]
KGRIAIFDRGWGRRVLEHGLHGGLKKRELAEYYGEINSFERQLSTDGCVIIKLFLHVSAKEQKKQYHKLKRAPSSGWWIDEGERLRPRDYAAVRRAADDLLENTHTPHAPWRVIAADHRKFASVAIFETICDSVTSALERTGGVSDVFRQPSRDRSGAARRTEAPEAGTNRAAGAGGEIAGQPVVGAGGRRGGAVGGEGRPGEGLLGRVDLSLTVSRVEYDRRLGRYQT